MNVYCHLKKLNDRPILIRFDRWNRLSVGVSKNGVGGEW